MWREFRPNMATLEGLTNALCRGLVNCPSHRKLGPTKGYRNKITYSLFPKLSTCDLADPLVNDACRVVDEFRTEKSTFSSEFWCEVCAKRTRRGEFMLKVSLCCTEETFEKWLAAEGRTGFADFVASRIPSCVALIVHGSKSSSVAMKPGKQDAYVSLIGSGSVTEYTPNGHAFLLSADSFCEVNHTMEDAMFVEAVRLLDLNGGHEAREKPRRRRRVFMTGRDVNSVYRTFAEYYDAPVLAVTTCPRVHHDTQLNGIDCELSTKDRIGPDHILPKVRAAALEGQQLKSSGCEDDVKFHFLMTAGRHGLHRDTVEALNAVAAHVDLLLYVSCNVESMARDLHLLKCRFLVRDAVTFDFFPGTDYVMTMLVLQPISGHRELLVLPVGPPAVGKSSSCRYFLQASLASNMETGDKVKATQHNLRLQRGSTSSVIRDMPRIKSQIAVTIFERDAEFHRQKESGCSLRVAKERTHSALLAAVEMTHEEHASNDPPTQCEHTARVLFVDSTNGSGDARRLYARVWAEKATHQRELVDVLVLQMQLSRGQLRPESSDEVDELCKRAENRKDHPAFPADEESRRRKIRDVLSALSAGAEEPSECTVETRQVHPVTADLVVENGATEEETAGGFSWHVYCFLYCSSSLAHRLIQSFRTLPASRLEVDAKTDGEVQRAGGKCAKRSRSPVFGSGGE